MSRPLLPLPDYQRIYQVAFSALEATGTAITHRACLFFASAGAFLLRQHYKLPATISIGCLALMVDEKNANVVVYGQEDGGEWNSTPEAFHAWVECDGWLIDFMAPIMGVSAQEDGARFMVPRRMLQKRLGDASRSPRHLQRAGDFFTHLDPSLGSTLMASQPPVFNELLRVCAAWHRKPPKPMRPMALGSSQAMLRLHAPSIEGVW